MTDVEQLRSDLRFVRHAVDRRETPYRTPAPILITWGVYVLIGYALLDVRPAAAGWFFLVGGIVGGVLSMWFGRRAARREGVVDPAEGLRHALHWGSILLGAMAAIALAVARPELRGPVVGQVIALIVGVVYFLGGVHFDRRFLWLGLILMAGAVTISFVPRYGWTALGALVGCGLIVPAMFHRRAADAPPTGPR